MVQNRKAVAVVPEYDEENDIYNCISALRITIPLIYIVSKQKQLEQEINI